MQPYGQQQPGAARKSGIGALGIVLIVVGVLFVGGLATCTVGYFWVKNKVETVVAEVAETGGKMVLISPPEVKAALAGDKKAYVGSWASKRGSTLSIDADGNMAFAKDEDGDGIKETITAPIADFSGNDIQCQALLTFTVHVTEPPKLVDGHWQMRADGIELHR